MAPIVNVLLSTFGGLDLPPTLSVPLCADVPVSTLFNILEDRLPSHAHNLVLSTNDSGRVDPESSSTLADVSHGSAILPLRLSSTLLGGKGGFGSQLRAAGGRMSSRKNKNNQRDVNGSSRNLDGRRLRTVTEAKNLAQYLAMKPDMDKKEKEERRARWEAVVEAAERREKEIKNGRKGVRLDGEWVEKKEEEESKTRDAVLAMMKAGLMPIDGPTGSESDEDEEGSEEMEVEAEASGSSESAEDAGGRSFFGWDEEDLSEDEDEDDDEADVIPAVAPVEQQSTYEGKGKGRA
ncbi:hypothetical protein K461DRAFT_127058 [Myriangium duriaei CBS 260.36]|uniref:Sde2 N-terminal ubiquitin domain-containing protein n=1 Tax=Myriangium duriaei CBS 260.36 TaxID=1168546 RepID=A0A9P4J3X7_9PEZI|nr:hypothetical protein K461DRAFT_127058 [Myriangium duriaei CBS 260.36]